MDKKKKEFFLSSWSINNRTVIFVITVIITLAGIMSYISIPKEQFPDIVIPTIYVSTIFPGTSPTDMENLVTKPIEKQIKSIAGVTKVTSNSLQDYSNVIVEFNTDVPVNIAKQRIKDAVDRARTDLPQDLPYDPNIIEVEFSEFPIMFINLAGNYDAASLKKYAEDLQDRIEALREITRVDIVGAPEREIQVNVDMYKMQAASLTMGDIDRAIGSENITISAGNVRTGDMTRTVKLSNEFKSMDELRNMVVNSQSGAPVYLKDVAQIADTFKDAESFGRLDHKNVITLNIIKRSGENLIVASDKIHGLVAQAQKDGTIPKDLKVNISADQSHLTRSTLHDLINTIIIGFILVTLVLMFFMGATNAMFVALSVPLSTFIAFLIFPSLGFSLNMIVLFSLLLALGIVVDDAIVVIENTHRIFNNGQVPIEMAAKQAAGEIFQPVLSGTLTTLSPFVPLLLWQGIIGKFMIYLPITLIVTLLASLLVAYTINPVFAVRFMKPHQREDKAKSNRGFRIVALVMIVFAALFYLPAMGGNKTALGFANFTMILLIFYTLHHFVLHTVIEKFQNSAWPAFQRVYERFIGFALNNPIKMIVGTVGLFIFTFFLLSVRSPNVVFFPQGDPNFVYVYVTLPVGTDIKYTDSITGLVEKKVYGVIGDKNPLVKSVITNVGIGANEAQDDRGTYSNKGKVGVEFVEFADRHGASTKQYLTEIRNAVKGIPGAELSVDQEQNGPPTEKPINIEISGDNYDSLLATADRLKFYLDAKQIPGVEELKPDVRSNKPEIAVNIDRERLNREGIFTGQVGMELRYAIFGKEVSRFRDQKDDYPIMLRYNRDLRNNLAALQELKITYRDMNMGGLIRQVPLSTFADFTNSSTYTEVKRKNFKRVITLWSNVLVGFNPNNVVASVQSQLADFKAPSGVEVKMTGEQEQQKETGAFLGKALMIAMMLIVLILVLQFNSISKPVMIMAEILFSLIGVFLGFAIFKMEISIVMTGVGIVALAGIVVRNGILLVEFTDVLLEEGRPLKEAIIQAGKIRMTPVILTATATILGLIPLAFGFNIDFGKLLTEFNPHIYFGGDNVKFWGPLSWTIIFGLSFATFLTLVILPVMYLLNERLKNRLFPNRKKKVVIDETETKPSDSGILDLGV